MTYSVTYICDNMVHKLVYVVFVLINVLSRWNQPALPRLVLGHVLVTA